MKLLVATHPSSLDHDTGELHPERPERVEAVLRGIEESGVETVRFEAPAADTADVLLVHDPSYLVEIEAFCRAGGGLLDTDTVVGPATWRAALHAAGAVSMLVQELETRSDATGFAVTRPPGHHALSARAMGFCLLNNVAITTARLRSEGARVAIVDWDAHHGNGTQEIVGEDPDVLYVSVHQDPLYPHEGRVGDLERTAVGTNVNIPLPPGTGGDVYREAWEAIVLPVVERFEPDWLLVSGGYDAHVADPLADMALVADDYGWMAGRLAQTVPARRIVVALEGGYDLKALADSVSATVRGLAGTSFDQAPLESPEASRRVLDTIKSAVSRHWDI